MPVIAQVFLCWDVGYIPTKKHPWNNGHVQGVHCSGLLQPGCPPMRSFSGTKHFNRPILRFRAITLEGGICGGAWRANAAALPPPVLQGAGGEGPLQQRGQSLQGVTLDYTDRSALEAAIQGMDVVVHTAGPYLGKAPDILDVRPAMKPRTCSVRTTTMLQ